MTDNQRVSYYLQNCIIQGVKKGRDRNQPPPPLERLDYTFITNYLLEDSADRKTVRILLECYQSIVYKVALQKEFEVYQ